MKKWNGWLLVLLAFGLTGCGEVQYHQRVGELEITMPWSREIPPNAPVAAGFLSIRNGGASDDRLVGVRSDASERVEIHEVRHEDGVARMRELTDGLLIPAGSTVELKPGGYHLMFITPKDGFKQDDVVLATLQFEKAGEVQVAFKVRPSTATGSQSANTHH
jgi:copper(I)-binding protein